MSDGLLIGSISTPPSQGYQASPADTVAVQLVESGLRVSYMIKGVGVMAELVEYRNNIGIRMHINAFGTCSGQGTAISDGKHIYVQDSSSLF